MEGRRQIADLIFRIDADVNAHVPVRDALGGNDDFLHGTADQPGDVQGEEDGQDDAGEEGAHYRHDGGVGQSVIRFRFLGRVLVLHGNEIQDGVLLVLFRLVTCVRQHQRHSFGIPVFLGQFQNLFQVPAEDDPCLEVFVILLLNAVGKNRLRELFLLRIEICAMPRDFLFFLCDLGRLTDQNALPHAHADHLEGGRQLR